MLKRVPAAWRSNRASQQSFMQQTVSTLMLMLMFSGSTVPHSLHRTFSFPDVFRISTRRMVAGVWPKIRSSPASSAAYRSILARIKKACSFCCVGKPRLAGGFRCKEIMGRRTRIYHFVLFTRTVKKKLLKSQDPRTQRDGGCKDYCIFCSLDVADFGETPGGVCDLQRGLPE
jgi:hypothetical protein